MAVRMQSRQLRERVDQLMLNNDRYGRTLRNPASQDRNPPWKLHR
jgi:hypothetical protein